MIDELTDKLIEKREKLDYFIVTAATAVIVFTFKDFNDPTGLLHTVSFWVPAAGWVVLLMASGCALFSLKRRHTLSSISLDWRYQGRKAPKDEHELKRINRNLRWVKVSDFLMGCLYRCRHGSSGPWLLAGSSTRDIVSTRKEGVRGIPQQGISREAQDGGSQASGQEDHAQEARSEEDGCAQDDTEEDRFA